MSRKRKMKSSEDMTAEEMMEKIQAGDASVLPALRKVMKHSPELVEKTGELAQITCSTILRQFIGDDVLTRVGVEQKMQNLREELEGPAPSPLERLLAERIVLTWLDAYHADLRTSDRLKKGMSWPDADGHERWKDRAHRRFLTACKTLAQVRKLLNPQVAQVNVSMGGKQMNVAAVADRSEDARRLK